MLSPVVLITGTSDLGTACALRLFRTGLKVVLLEKSNPLDLYHSRCFSSAVFAGIKTIEQIKATTFSYFLTEISDKPLNSIEQFLNYQLENRQIPVLLESELNAITTFKIDFTIITSYDLFKNNSEVLKSTGKIIGFDDKPIPDYFDYTICNKGFNSSRVFYPFLEDEYINEGAIPSVEKKCEKIRAPIEGVFEANKQINEIAHEKDILGKIAGIPILSPERGKVTGILNSGLIVPAHEPFIEIDTREPYHNGNRISSESFNLAGGVLEAINYNLNLNS
jgi:xanthine dehydrogenase accessory factor